MGSFFVWSFDRSFFCAYILGLNFFRRKNIGANVLIHIGEIDHWPCHSSIFQHTKFVTFHIIWQFFAIDFKAFLFSSASVGFLLTKWMDGGSSPALDLVPRCKRRCQNGGSCINGKNRFVNVTVVKSYTILQLKIIFFYVYKNVPKFAIFHCSVKNDC